MRKTNRILIIIGIGLLLAGISRAGSFAVTQISCDRTTASVDIVADSAGILQLSGFNDSYVLTDSFSSVGSIGNNSTSSLQLRLNIDPNITLARQNPVNKKINWTLTLRLQRSGGLYNDYTFFGNGPQNPKSTWTGSFTIAPGETFALSALMSTTYTGGYLFAADSSFIFDATGTNGLKIYIADTAGSPRLHQYSSSR